MLQDLQLHFNSHDTKQFHNMPSRIVGEVRQLQAMVRAGDESSSGQSITNSPC